MLNNENFCILRTAKLKTFGSIAGSAMHTFREIRTPNVDAKRSHLNRTVGPDSSAAVVEVIKNLLPKKRRKDAVLCIEYLITASPDWFKSIKPLEYEKYFEQAIKWLKLKHGDANVICLNYQFDETSPHLVAYIVPKLSDGRLSAKEFLGGRVKLSQMQTDFWKNVGEAFGLSRGLQGSISKHVTAKEYSAALSKRKNFDFPILPEFTVVDHINGNARKQQLEYRRSVLKYMRLAEQINNVTKLREKARSSDRKIQESYNLKEKELEEYLKKINRLENKYTSILNQLSLEKVNNSNLIEKSHIDTVKFKKTFENFLKEKGDLQKLLQLRDQIIFELKNELRRYRPSSSSEMSP